MTLTYDPLKNKANIEKHGISFDAVYEFDFEGCFTFIDDRKDYGEVRYVSVGEYKGRLYVLYCVMWKRERVSV